MAKRWRTLLVGMCLLTILQMMGAAPASAKSVFNKKPKEQYVPGASWEAYIHDDEGNSRALVQPVEQNEDKDWMFLSFTEYKGPRNRLAVMKVENKIASVEQAESSAAFLVTNRIAEVPVAAIEELLTTALFNTNRFDLTERKAVQTVLAEQDFGNSDRVSQPTAAKLGKVLGAEYLIFAAVNEWTPEKKRVGGGLGGIAGGVMGGVGAGKTTSEIAMSFRIVDATTGQVLFAATERAEAGSWGIRIGGFGGPAAGGGGFDRNSPIGYAVQSCINKVAYKIAMNLKDRAWTGTVVKVDGDKVYINAGGNKGLEIGMKLVALAKGEALVDPETGVSLGEDTEAVGNLQITTVKDNFSIATVVQGCESLKAGDRVEMASGGS